MNYLRGRITSDTQFEHNVFSSNIESVEGFSRISVMLFYEIMQIFVIEFIQYVTLLKWGMYKDSALLNLVWVGMYITTS